MVMSPTEGATEDDLIVIRDLVRSELENRGIAEPDVRVEGSNIVVDLPGVRDQREALDAADVAGIVTLRPVLQCVAGATDGSSSTVPGSTTPDGSAPTSAPAGASTPSTTPATSTPATPAGLRAPVGSPSTPPSTVPPTTPPTSAATPASTPTSTPSIRAIDDTAVGGPADARWRHLPRRSSGWHG